MLIYVIFAIAMVMNILDSLQKVPIFAGLSMTQLQELEPLARMEEYQKDTMIIKEGSAADSMFVIVEGSIRVTKKSGGRNVLITNMGVGSYFGELALIDNQPRSADVTTNEKSILFRLKKDSFDRLLEENQEFAIHFYRNCLAETMFRYRETATNFTMSQNVLQEKSSRLNRIDSDLLEAKAVQDYFIDTRTLENNQELLPGIEQSYIYRPSFEVGGDFLNVNKIDDQRVGIIIADVMGHGISAAMATGVIKSAFSIFSKEYATKPAALLQELNLHFNEVFDQLYATCVYVLLDLNLNEISLARAGHNLPLFFSNTDQHASYINSKGVGLGIVPRPMFEEYKIPIRKGDKLMLYTDGIVEQRNPNREMFDEERLLDSFCRSAQNPFLNILETVFTHLQDFSETRNFTDDITLFLLEF